jgi:transcriptional regulator with PAS, ATPase and Fis domain
MPETLIDSELFCFSDGSFTGARKGGQAGKFELANGGTVFLDEIGEMSAPMQAKLLRVLQERTVQRIGSPHEISVDIRIIAATHRDLSKDVEDRRFREDLYYRIAVLEVKIPPLRERTEDIPSLAHCLVNRICKRLERPPVEICDECLRKLATYAWPGNVREMENVLERAIISLRGAGCINAENVELPANSPQRSRDKHAGPGSEQPVNSSRPSARSLRETEKEAIAEALRSSGGNIKRAAARLGIARNTLYRKMEDYGLVAEGQARE